jgi:hypothetical protein
VKSLTCMVALGFALTLALAGTAVAKGVSGASISGPNLRHDAELGIRASNRLADLVGFYPSVFETVPDPTLAGRPKSLGPRYRISYELLGDERGRNTATVKQDLYPYAAGGPVAHVAAGQKLPEGMGDATGGWFRAPGYALDQLTSLGLPKGDPVAGAEPGAPAHVKQQSKPAASNEPVTAATSPSLLWAGVAAVALIAALWLLGSRRRTRSTTTA